MRGAKKKLQALGKDYQTTETEIFAYVWVNGATRVLTFTMNKQRHQNYLKHIDEQQGQAEMNVYLLIFITVFYYAILFFDVISVLSLRGFGLSVIDKTPKELIYLI